LLCDIDMARTIAGKIQPGNAWLCLLFIRFIVNAHEREDVLYLCNLQIGILSTCRQIEDAGVPEFGRSDIA